MVNSTTREVFGAGISSMNLARSNDSLRLLEEGEHITLHSDQQEVAHTDENHDEEIIIDENTPLLGPSTEGTFSEPESGSRANKGRYKTILLFFLLLISAAFLFEKVKVDMKDSFDVSISNFSITHVSSKSVIFNVTGIVTPEYDRIENPLERITVRAISRIIGYIGFEYTSISLLLDMSRTPKEPVAFIVPSNFEIQTGDGTPSLFDLEAEILLNKPGSARFLQRLKKLELEGSELYIDVAVKASIYSRVFRYVPLSTVFHSKVVFNSDKILKFDEINLTSVRSINESLLLSTNLITSKSLPLNLQIPETYWNISISGCRNEDIEVAIIHNERINMKNGEKLVIDMQSLIPKFSEELMKQCDNGKSPLDIMIEKLVKKEDIRVLVRGDYSNNKLAHNELIAHILSEISIYLFVDAYELKKSLKECLSLKIEDYYYCLKSDLIGEPPLLEISSNLSGAFQNSGINFDIGLENMTGSINIWKGNHSMASIQLEEENEIHTSYTNTSISDFDIRLQKSEVEITNATLVGTTLNDIFNDQHGDEHYELRYQLGVDVISPLGKFELRNMEGSHLFKLLQGLNLSRLLSYSLKGTNVSVLSMSCASSTFDMLELDIEFALTNPTNFSFDFNGEEINSSLIINETIIGQFKWSDPLINNSDDGAINKATIKLMTNDHFSKAVAEEFLGKVISGIPDVSVSIQGENSDSSLGNIFSQVHLESLPIPDTKFVTPYNTFSKSSQSPFFLGATIHLLTSDVEAILFNPISNENIEVVLYEAEAIHDDIVLGHVSKPHKFSVPPGISKTPRIPVTTNSGIGMDLLRDALNGVLEVDVLATLSSKVANYEMRILYIGNDLPSNVRL